jgi:hypothetical protein
MHFTADADLPRRARGLCIYITTLMGTLSCFVDAENETGDYAEPWGYGKVAQEGVHNRGRSTTESTNKEGRKRVETIGLWARKWE